MAGRKMSTKAEAQRRFSSAWRKGQSTGEWVKGAASTVVAPGVEDDIQARRGLGWAKACRRSSPARVKPNARRCSCQKAAIYIAQCIPPLRQRALEFGDEFADDTSAACFWVLRSC